MLASETALMFSRASAADVNGLKAASFTIFPNRSSSLSQSTGGFASAADFQGASGVPGEEKGERGPDRVLDFLCRGADLIDACDLQ